MVTTVTLELEFSRAIECILRPEHSSSIPRGAMSNSTADPTIAFLKSESGTEPMNNTNFDYKALHPEKKRYRGVSSRVDMPQEYSDDITDDITFVAASPEMVRIRQRIHKVAPVDVPVFLSGECGTGKEVLARMIHMRSSRKDHAFVKINCAATPGELLESELFGYEQGAFTGAIRSNPGKFELANKGTIFLDEIAEMNPALQAKLLHVLKDYEFSRIGGRGPIDINSRIIAATNLDAVAAMKSGRLRQDLYYRLSVISIDIPPLRKRPADIPPLFSYFLKKYSAKFNIRLVTPPLRLLKEITHHPWPGNLHELENFAKRYVVLEGDVDSLGGMAQKANSHEPAPPLPQTDLVAEPDLTELTRSAIKVAVIKTVLSALDRMDWNIKNSAMILGISNSTLRYYIRQFDLAKYRDSTPDLPKGPKIVSAEMTSAQKRKLLDIAEANLETANIERDFKGAAGN